MKIILITLSCLFVFNIASAQFKHFATSGSIEFEKTINLYALARGQMGKNPGELQQQMFDQYKKSKPQFKKLPATLLFSHEKTLFTPGASVSDERVMGNDNPMAKQFNLVYTDLATDQSIIQKTAYEDTYLLKDSTRKINWKITDETREIAGYNCRRANAVIMDSVYVVAFYTNEIHVSGGPETFTGLPGMILGLALPHENVTWFATKVTEGGVQPTAITPPKKGRPVNSKQLSAILKDAFKNWYGDRGFYEIKVFTL